MMNINRPSDTPVFVNSIAGSTKNTKNIVAGQLLVADSKNPVSNPNGSWGLGYASNLKRPKNEKFLKVVVGNGAEGFASTRSHKRKDFEIEHFFALQDITGIEVEYPKVFKQELDEWIIGWNGNLTDSHTSFDFREYDKNLGIRVEVEGLPVSYGGGATNKEVIVFNETIGKILPEMSCQVLDPCDPVPCKEITMKIVETMRETKLAGGYKFSDLAEITPIFSCDQTVGNVVYSFWETSNCDLGGINDLARVQNGVTSQVVRTERRGATSIYQTMVLGTSSPSNVTITGNSIFAECDTCPTGYTKTNSGYIYTYTKLDTGSSAPVTIPDQVSGTNIFQGTVDGVSSYTVKTTALLTPAQIQTLYTSNPTMVIDLVGDIPTVCDPNGSTTLTWTKVSECEASTKQFRISLPDNSCGGDRLEELQKTYPNLTIALDPADVTNTFTATLTGTSGTGDFTIDGVNYLATFATDLTTTASDFVTANESAIEALGGELTSNNAVITFTLPATLGAVTFTNASGNLGATIVSSSAVSASGCRAHYIATVPTNITCEECDPAFRDVYVAKAPQDYEGAKWTPYNEPAPSTNCLCGIRIKARPFDIDPSNCIDDGKIQFVESSAKLKVSAGIGAQMDLNVNLYTTAFDEHFVNVEQRGFQKHRDMLAGNLKMSEALSYYHFTDEKIGKKPLSKVLRGSDSVIDDNKQQMAMVKLKLEIGKFSQSMSNRDRFPYTYSFYAPIGSQFEALKAEMVRLAAAAEVVQSQNVNS